MKLRILTAVIVAVCVLLILVGCSAASSGSGSLSSSSADESIKDLPDTSEGSKSMGDYRKITAEEAKKMMDEQSGIIVLDVRSKAEFDEGHISGAVLISNEEITDTPPAQFSDKDATILVYCRSGNRSRQASEKLIAMGYTNVYDFGGIRDWPYDVVTD